MKVLIFMTQFYQLGGAERLAVELAEELNSRGVHTDILSLYSADLPGVARAAEALRERGIPEIHFLNMRPHPSAGSLVPAVRRLRRLIRQNEYNIIETSAVLPMILTAWATRGTAARHIAGLHGAFDSDRDTSSLHRACRLSARCNRRVRYYAISKYVAEAWAKFSGTSRAHIRVVYNSISDRSFDALPDRDGVRKELGIPECARIALYVGRLVRYKGIEVLLDALGPILASQNMVLVYVGWIDPNPNGESETIHETLQRMRCKAKQKGWDERIRFLEFRSDIPRLMASSDILVHPTRRDGFGLALAEAMAAGLPVVSTNVEGIPEVLVGTDAIMVPPDDPEALCNAVLKVLGCSTEESAVASARARLRAGTFRTGNRATQMLQMFHDALAGDDQESDRA